MHWELWETESANLVETFDTEAEGLQAVREMLAVNKPDLIDSLVLGASFDEDEPDDVALPPVLGGEALKARLAELAHEEIAEATHKVHARIRKWLTEEGWRVEDFPDDNSHFNLIVSLANGQTMNIIQSKGKVDSFVITTRLSLQDNIGPSFSKLPIQRQGDVVWGLFRDLSIIGVEFRGPGIPLSEIEYFAPVFFDGLTKDTLIQRMYMISRALTLSAGTLLRALNELEGDDRPSEATVHPLRVVGPPADSLLRAVG